jgi:hypothetical protein
MSVTVAAMRPVGTSRLSSGMLLVVAASAAALGVALGLSISDFGVVIAAAACAAIVLLVVVSARWGAEGTVLLLLVASMLPLPTLAVGTIGFPLATVAVLFILAAALLSARRRGLQSGVPHLTPYLMLIAVAAISLAASWLFWDARVPTGTARGYGHRWIGYQLTGLYLLAVPAIAYAGGVLSSRVMRVERLYGCVLAVLAVLTLYGLSQWVQHPVNPIAAFAEGVRTKIDYQWAAFMLAIAVALAFHARRRDLRAIAVLLILLGGLTATVQYVLSAWLALGATITVLICLRFGVRGFVLWLGTITLLGLLAEPVVSAVVAQRASSPDIDRLQLWQSALVIWSKGPVWGIGPGNFASYMEAYNAFPLGLVLQGYQQAHNIFLEILAEEGAIGIALLAVFVVLVLRTLLRFRAVGAADGFLRSAGIGVLLTAAIIAALGGGFVPTIASAGYNALPKILIEWFLVGCAVGVAQQRSRPVVPATHHGR